MIGAIDAILPKHPSSLSRFSSLASPLTLRAYHRARLPAALPSVYGTSVQLLLLNGEYYQELSLDGKELAEMPSSVAIVGLLNGQYICLALIQLVRGLSIDTLKSSHNL